MSTHDPSRRAVLRAGVAAGALASLPACRASSEAPTPGRADNALASAAVQGPEILVRRSEDRGRVERDWLSARHSFSFSSYRDPEWMGFRSLRVINEDRIVGGGGFPMHPHQDMEILTYVMDGRLEHRDTLLNGGIIQPGDMQYMSAGSGIRHSEFNPDPDRSVHLLQIWVTPMVRGAAPRYNERGFGSERNDDLRLVASLSGRDGSLAVRQDMDLYASVLRTGQTLRHDARSGRGTWIQVAGGELEANGTILRQGDAGFTELDGPISLRARSDAEFLLFDLA